jgi:transposase
MGDSIGVDSLLGGGTMPAAYSVDIRGRVIARVESGSSRREAAEHFEVSPSFAIKWVAFYLSGEWKLCRQATGREYIAAGRARGLLVGADQEAAGLDAG